MFNPPRIQYPREYYPACRNHVEPHRRVSSRMSSAFSNDITVSNTPRRLFSPQKLRVSSLNLACTFSSVGIKAAHPVSSSISYVSLPLSLTPNRGVVQY